MHASISKLIRKLCVSVRVVVCSVDRGYTHAKLVSPDHSVALGSVLEIDLKLYLKFPLPNRSGGHSHTLVLMEYVDGMTTMVRFTYYFN